MKSLKKAVLVILALNLLAVLGGIGWIFSSGRVNKDRVLAMTQLFSEPVSVENARLASEKKAEEEALAAQEQPLPAMAFNSDERNLVRVEMTQVDRARLERMKREVEDLQLTLRTERIKIAQDRDALAQEMAEFDAMRERLAGLEGTKQFKKALATLSGLSPKDAKAVLSALLGESPLTNGKYEEVISYLSAMEDRTRTSVLSEFIKAGEDALAADLLESVRLRGLETTTASGNTP